MKVKYIGPSGSGVDVVMPDGRADVQVEHGGVLETTAEHAAALLEQPANWEAVKASKAEKKKGDDS